MFHSWGCNQNTNNFIYCLVAMQFIVSAPSFWGPPQIQNNTSTFFLFIHFYTRFSSGEGCCGSSPRMTRNTPEQQQPQIVLLVPHQDGFWAAFPLLCQQNMPR